MKEFGEIITTSGNLTYYQILKLAANIELSYLISPRAFCGWRLEGNSADIS